MIAEVIPEKRTGALKSIYTYKVPEALKDKLKIGSIVEVPFGDKKIRAVINKIQDASNLPADRQTDYELKEILSIEKLYFIPKPYLEVCHWISEYYLCSLGEAISLFLPPESVKKKEEINLCEQTTKKLNKLNNDQEIIFQKLKEKFIAINSTNSNAIENKPALICGVTGSGKTEIYMRLCQECLKLNKKVVILVPEIMLTSQMINRFKEIFEHNVLLTHSGLSKGEKSRCYEKFFLGKEKILIGPRSALLIPSPEIGLIIVDEEHEDAYKQEKNPRYHAVNLAEKIAEKVDALLILGSATPRIESYFKAKNKEYDLFILNSRYLNLLLPVASIVDLKEEIKKENYSPISLALGKSIQKVLDNKRQIILFLNRRGTATFVSCRECGEVILCPRCNIPLVYHVNDTYHYLNCHHCDFKSSVPAVCPSCQGKKIKFFGIGIEKIAQEIKKLFPKAKIKLIDSKSLQKKDDYLHLYEDIIKRKYDILIGTQILAKGLDIPTVDLVGIISADTGLHMPYYKASEKVFQLVTQVSGRSGRRDNNGQTIIQSYWPDAAAINLAAKHDFVSFYEAEILEREKFSYPPFYHLIRVISENSNSEKAKTDISKIAKQLSAKGIDFTGPAKCFLSKINNRYRYHLIIKMKDLPNDKISDIFKTNPYLIWDVEPVNLL